MREYIIQKGCHYANGNSILDIVPFPHFRLNRSFQYKFIIEASNFNEMTTQDSWNKLFGIGTGNSSRSNSIRIGWRFNKKKITYEWCIFREVDKKFWWSPSLEGASCTLIYDKEKALFSMQVGKESIDFNLNGNQETDENTRILKAKILLELQPYFGGNATADTQYKITRI